MPRLLPSHFDEANLWMLLIDYHFIEHDALGLIYYERREAGCIPALFKAYRCMLSKPNLSLLDTAVNVEQVVDEIVVRLLEYHKLLTTGVEALNPSIVSGAFRTHLVGYGLTSKTSTREGIQFLRERPHVRGPNDDKIPLYYNVDEKLKINCRSMAVGETEAIFRMLTQRLVQDLRSDACTDILVPIASFMQDAMALHPFADANNRTLVVILLNDILYSIGESPTLFREANVVDGFDINVLVAAMRDAQNLYVAITSGQRTPSASIRGMLNTELIHLAAAAGENALIRRILSLATNKEKMLSAKVAFSRFEKKLPLQVAIDSEQETTVHFLCEEMGLNQKLKEIVLNLLSSKQNNIDNLCEKITKLSRDEIAQLIRLDIMRAIPEASKIILILIYIRLQGSDVANIVRSEINILFFEIEEISALLQATNSMQEHKQICIFLASEAGLNITMRGAANVNLEIFPHDLWLDLVANSLYGLKPASADKYLCETRDVGLLFRVMERGVLRCGATQGRDILPDRLDVEFIIKFGLLQDNKDELLNGIFADVVPQTLQGYKILYHICIDVNSIFKLISAFPQVKPRVIQLLLERNDFLRQLCTTVEDLESLLNLLPEQSQVFLDAVKHDAFMIKKMANSNIQQITALASLYANESDKDHIMIYAGPAIQRFKLACKPSSLDIFEELVALYPDCKAALWRMLRTEQFIESVPFSDKARLESLFQEHIGEQQRLSSKNKPN